MLDHRTGARLVFIDTGHLFQSGFLFFFFLTNFYSHHQDVRVLISPYYFQYLVCSFSLFLAILETVQQSLIIILICISLITKKAKHIFICLLSILSSSFHQCLFNFPVHFSITLLSLNLQTHSLKKCILDLGPSSVEVQKCLFNRCLPFHSLSNILW